MRVEELDRAADLTGAIVVEVVDRGVWSLSISFGKGDEARDRMRAYSACIRNRIKELETNNG